MPQEPQTGAGQETGRTLNRRGLLSCLALGVAALAGCQPPPQAPLKLGLNPWVGYDPMVLARERGLLDAAQVKVVELASSSETMRYLRNGLLDGAALTLDETLRLADDGVDLRIVRLLSTSAGADVVMARPDIRTLTDLRGRSIAVERTTVGALMLQRLLQAGGLQPHEVQVRNLEASRHLAALRNGLVDAVVTFEPLAGPLQAEGLRPLFDSRQMPGDIVDVLVVRAEVLSARRSQVEVAVLGWRRGLSALESDPQASAELLSAGVDLSPGDYLTTLKGLKFYSDQESQALLSGRPRALGQQSEGLAITLGFMGLIRETPDWGRLLDEDWADRLRTLEGAQP
ncbi:ABC transporter substrate-binding protein [Hydrogenophaga luteola]|uniref:ABC transporter substrate-binding protein n=1 Tax=Hydrogenophaga luteola TaxID=1591122 RepID=A0ABV7W9C7_9BURK